MKRPTGSESERIAVAMSGGVDSSVAAALLRDRGHEVFGITMLVSAPDEQRSAGTEENAAAAAAVASHLGIRHICVDLSSEFRQGVVEPFISSYLCGRTPNPCIVCNACIKFGALLKAATALGAQALAGGHYCRRAVSVDGRVELRVAADRTKDQSYFLFHLSQDQLRRARFPLSELTKERVRRLAAEMGLPSAERPESQEVCFAPGGDYTRLIGAPGSAVASCSGANAGDIVDGSGRVLGRHNGVYLFTVGQRRGLRIPAERPLYVLSIDAGSRRVVVGFEEELARTDIELSGVNWVSIPAPSDTVSAEVKIRFRARPAPCEIDSLAEGRALLRFASPRRGVAPGQAAVFYRGDLLLGGGWIE